MLTKIFIFFTAIVIVIRFKSKLISEFIKLRYHFKMFLYYVLVTLVSIIVMPIIILRPKHHSNGILTSSLMKHITKLYRVTWHLRNEEILAEDCGAIIISNHQSGLDIAALNHIWHAANKVTVIAKKEVFYTGPLGLTMYLCGAIFIDRKKTKEAYNILEGTKKIMTKNKMKIWIFPEGTRNRQCRGKLLPFKKGAFNAAVSAQVPIIPVVISPYYFIDEEKYIFDNKGHIIIQCLEPVSTKGLTLNDVPALADRLHQIMSRTYEQLSKEVLSSTREGRK